MSRTRRGPTFCLVAGLLLSDPAAAAELYLSGQLGNSAGLGESSGETEFFDIDGDDVDASPSYGGTLGLGFAMDEAVPSIKGFELPSWKVRGEFEFLTGRDYELRSDGATAGRLLHGGGRLDAHAERVGGPAAADADLVAVRARPHPRADEPLRGAAASASRAWK